MRRVKVLIIDDSALMRKKITEMLDSAFGVEVCGTARNGEDGIRKAEELKPDVITLDVNMPVMDGLTALRIIIEKKMYPVIMLSSLTQEGTSTTFEAMEIGAFDFVAKPSGTVSRDIDVVRRELVRKIKAAAGSGFSKVTRRIEVEEIAEDEQVNDEMELAPVDSSGFKAVCIGISTGGPKTIFDVIPRLPADLNAAVFLVQHMPVGFTEAFAKRLNRSSRLYVKEAAPGDIVTPGVCYVGKSGYHMTVYKKHSGVVTLRMSKSPDHAFIPSADVMMESVSKAFGSNTLGALMTGMGDDGAKSMCYIKRSGGFTIAESEETAIVYGMPREAVELGCADIVLPSGKIAGEIIRKISRGW